MMKKGATIVSLVLCILLFSAMALGSGSSSSKAEKVGEVTSTAAGGQEASKAAGDTQAATEATTAAATEAASSKTEFYVGDTFEKDGLLITYVSSSYYASDNQFITPAEGNQFIRLFFHVENQSSSDENISYFSFDCYADGYECSAHYNDEDNLSATLSSGRTTDGAVYFEVPTDAKSVEVEYEVNAFTDEKVIFHFEGDKDSGLTFEKNTTPSANTFHVGDIIETDDLRITYLSTADYTSDNMFLQPAEGMKYVYIELEVENISKSDQTISYLSFECFADGASCDGFYSMDDALSATISSGRKAKGTIAFEVPADAAVIEIEYETNVWTDERIIFTVK